jgi:GntR family transcriptional regulator
MTRSPDSQLAALRAAPGPLYLHAAAILRRRIETAELRPGERLPAMERLARQLGVAVVTVRSAVALLVQDGLLVAQQGRGTFVADPLPARRVLAVGSSWTSLLAAVGRSEARILAVADTIGMPRLAPRDGRPASAYRCMRRLHLADGKPYVVIDIWLDRAIYSRQPRAFDEGMVVVLLDTMPGVHIAEARQTLTIGTAGLEEAAHLGIAANSPVGRVRRVVRDAAGTAIYVGEAVYRGDDVVLEQTLERPA